MKAFITNNKWNLLLIIIYAVITCITMFHHAFLEDELRQLHIVRDYNFTNMLQMIRYDGHPFLLYFLIFPFVKAGGSAFSIQIIAWFFMLAAVALFTLKAPFNLLFKIIFLFNAGMIFYYPVVARHYSLIPLFLFLLAYFYPKRHEMPFVYSILIILLFQTHSYIGGFCLILSLIFIFEPFAITKSEKPYTACVWASGGGKTHIISVFLLILNYIFLFFCYKSVIKNEAYGVSCSSLLDFIGFCSNFRVEFYSLCRLLADDLSSYLITLIVIISILTFYQSKKIFLILLFSIFCVMHLYINVSGWGDIYNKAFIIPLVIVFCAWAIHNYSEHNFAYKIFQIALLVFFTIILISVNSVQIIKNEIQYEFSDMQNIEKLIKTLKKGEKKLLIIQGNCFTTCDSAIDCCLLEGNENNGFDTTKMSLSEYINLRLNEENNNYPDFREKKEINKKDFINADFIFVGFDVHFKDYSGYKKIYESKAVNLGARTPMRYNEIIWTGDLYIPDSKSEQF